MIRWFLAHSHLSHLQADDNYACHLLTAKIFQIGCPKMWYTSIHMATLLRKDLFQCSGIGVYPQISGTFRQMGPTKSGTMWRPAMMLPPPGWVVLPPAAPWNLGKGDIWTMKNLEIWWRFCSKIGSLILAWRELILGNWDLRLKNLWKSPSKDMERNRMGVCRCFSQWAVL